MEGGNPAQEVYNASLEMAQPMAWMPWKACKTGHEMHGQARRTESHPLLTTSLLTVSLSGAQIGTAAHAIHHFQSAKTQLCMIISHTHTHTHI